MKKLLFIVSAGIICLCTSCGSKNGTAMSGKTKKNIESMHGITNCFIKKDFSKLGDFVAEDCIDHSGNLKGLAQMKAEFAKWTTMIDDTRTTTIVEMANDEYVISWVRFDLTMKTDMGGMKNGQGFNKTDIEVARFRDGKAIEHWTFMEPSEMEKVLSPSAPAK